MTKRFSLITVSALTILALATTAMAYGGHGYGHRGAGMGPGMNGYAQGACPGWGANSAAANLTPEQRETAQALLDDFTAKMIPVRQELMVKHAQLRAALMAPEVDTAAVEALSGDIAELRTSLFTHGVELREAFKDAGIPANAGFGRHHRGMGPGMHHGRGHGMWNNPGI